MTGFRKECNTGHIWINSYYVKHMLLICYLFFMLLICFCKTYVIKISEKTNTSYPLILKRSCAYQEILVFRKILRVY